MITNLMTLSFRASTNSGVLIPWIGSLAVTMPSCQDLTLGFSNQVPKRLTRFARTGDLTTIGCIPEFVSSLGLLSIWRCARPEGP